MNFNEHLFRNINYYLIVDINEHESEDRLLDYIASCLEDGIKIIQLENRFCSTKSFIKKGKKVRELCSIYNALLIIKDRLDIALIVNADGAHLGQEDTDIKSARHILKHEGIIGITVETDEELEEAIKNKADYIITHNSKIPQKINNIPTFINTSDKKSTHSIFTKSSI